MKRFQKAGRGVAPQGRIPEPHCSLHAQGFKLSCQTQGPELALTPYYEIPDAAKELVYKLQTNKKGWKGVMASTEVAK